MSDKQAVLLIDDDSDAVLSLAKALKTQLEAQIFAVSTAIKAIELAGQQDPSVIVLDLSLDESRGVESGFELLEQLLKLLPHCRIIVLTGHASTTHGVQSLQRGAAHFLDKPAQIPHLLALIKDGLQQSNLRREYARMSHSGVQDLEDYLVGTSAHMQQVRQSIFYAAQTNLSVLITGETGTGKGLCALALHRFSARKSKHFVRFQPTLGNADLIGSQLFGHRKGSYTGATEDRKGLIAEAHMGTLFLDEIDELPQDTQVSMLGVLQERKFRALGSNIEEEANFRLVSACNGNVEQSLETGKLRRDFFHRIAHFRIHLEPLRNRKKDIPVLVEKILAQLREREQLNVYSCTPDALQVLSNFEYPGNVRELESILHAAIYQAQFRGVTQIDLRDLEGLLPRKAPPSNGVGYHHQVTNYKLSLIRDALERHSGNQIKASEELGLDRSTMRRILKSSECTEH